MPILHPLSKNYCKSDKEYEILKNWCESHERSNNNIGMNIEFSEKELKKVKAKIDKSITKVFK